MRRWLQFVLLVMFVTASTTGVRASTDCERWFIAYKQQLAHAKSVQRIEAARRRARLYAKRKLANYVKPANPKPHVPRRRPMSREETLRHFNLACGVLPEEAADKPLVSEETLPEFAPHLRDFLPTDPVEEGTEIANYIAPPYIPPGFGPPADGGPPIYYPPFGGTGGSFTPGTPGNPGTPGTPGTPDIPEVPEPGSIVLLLTGLAAAAGAVRRRFRQ